MNDNGILRGQDGRIIKGRKLSTEEARELANRRWDKERIEAVGELLSEFGFESADDAPPHLKLLATKAAVSGSGSVTALVQLIRSLRESRAFDDGVKIRLKPGELCPTCNQFFRAELGYKLIREILIQTGGLPMDDDIKAEDNYA